MAAERHVIIHYHIFKNAGSTLAAALERNFGPTFASWDGNEFNAQISDAELLQFLQEHCHVLAVTSHHLRPPKPRADSFVFHDVLVLRHPVDRIRSMYDFYRSALPTDDPLTQDAKRLNQRAFFELLIERYPHLVTNSQVNYVANQGGKIPDEGDCERACNTVREAAVAGVADQFDICMAVAEHRLRKFYPGLDLSYVSENVTRGRRKGMKERLEEFEKQCGGDVYARLVQLNQLDVRLTEFARSDALSRFEELPSADAYLLEFKQRVKKRRTKSPFALSIDHPGDFSAFTRTE
jgi:Sulfotransferase family